jgi:hypothetical protein
MPINNDESLFAILADAGDTLDRDANHPVDEPAPETLEVAAPHVVYALGRDALLDGTGQDAVDQTGWRYLLMSSGSTIGTIEVGGDIDENPVIASVSDRDVAIAFEIAIRLAEEHSEVEAGDYEARLLRVPAVYAELLWLHDRSEYRDLVVPVLSVPGLEINTFYPIDVALDILREEAKRVADFDSTPLS